MSENKAHQTTQCEVVQAWAEERNGKPACIKGSREKKYGGILRIDFGNSDEKLEQIDWAEFFKIFEERKLSFMCSYNQVVST